MYWIGTTFQIASSSKDINKVFFTKMSAAYRSYLWKFACTLNAKQSNPYNSSHWTLKQTNILICIASALHLLDFSLAHP
nr:unnamed protein product [Callosobruchus analis]